MVTPLPKNHPSGARTAEEDAARYRAMRRERRGHVDSEWLLLIKELRALHQVGIFEAERIALSNPHRRKWVERQINNDQGCRKYALAHIRYNKAASLIEREGDSFVFRIPPPPPPRRD